MPTLSLKSETMKVTGDMNPCHRPSQKPTSELLVASWLPEAAQPDSTVMSA